MDCQSARELMAGWVDAQLSPGQQEQMDEHLARCRTCAAQIGAMEAQELVPPQHILPGPAFWARMDRALAPELELLAAPPAHPAPAPAGRTPPLRRAPWRLQVGWPSMLLYVALLALAVGWGLHTQQALQASQAETAALQRELEREKRLAAQPSSPPPAGYRVARGTHSRGTL